MMVMDFYAYWNVEELTALFNAVAGLMTTQSYITLMKALTLLGFLFVLISGAWLGRLSDALSMGVAVVMFFFLFYEERMTVVIQDVRSAEVSAIENVPVGIGFAACSASLIGHWLTNAFETAFSETDAEKFSRFGVAFPQRAVALLAVSGPVTQEGRESLNGFITSCVAPELVESEAKLIELLRSPDLLETISRNGWVNPARYSVMPSGTVLRCSEALPALKAILERTELPALERVLQTKLDAGKAATLITGGIEKAVPQAQALMLGVSRDLHTSLKQSLLLNTIPDGIKSFAQRSDEAMTSAITLAKAQGNLASEINYRTLSELARSALPKIRNILEFITIAVAPVLVLMLFALGHKGGAVLRSYLTLLIWVQLWAPITAVINYLTIHVDRDPMNQLIQLYGGNTLEAATFIREAGASSAAMAGALMMLVPVVAWAIAKGSDMAATQLATAVLAPAQQAAQSFGASLANGNFQSGNLSIGNESTNNVSGFKNDLSMGYVSSNLSKRTTPYGSVTRDEEHAIATGMSVTPIALGTSSSVEHSLSRALSQNKTSDWESGNTQTSAWSNAQSVSKTSARSDTHIASTSEVSGEEQSQTHAYGTQQNASTQLGVTSTLSQGSGTTVGAAFSIQSSVGIRDNKRLPFAPIGNDLLKGAMKANDVDTPHPASFNSNNALALGGQAKNTTQMSDTTDNNVSTTFNNGFIQNTTSGQSQSTIKTASHVASDIAALSNNHANTKTDNLSSNNAQADSLSHSEVLRNGHAQQLGDARKTVIDQSPVMMEDAIQTYGSPEKALEENFNIGNRMNFGRHIAQKEDISMKRDTGIIQGPSTSLTMIDRFNEKSEINQDTNKAWLERENNQPLPHAASQPQTNTLSKSSQQLPQNVSANDNLLLYRGAMIAANALYRQKDIGILPTVSRAFLNGHTQGMKALTSALLEKSLSDKTLRMQLLSFATASQTPSDEGVLKSLAESEQ